MIFLMRARGRLFDLNSFGDDVMDSVSCNCWAQKDWSAAWSCGLGGCGMPYWGIPGKAMLGPGPWSPSPCAHDGRRNGFSVEAAGEERSRGGQIQRERAVCAGRRSNDDAGAGCPRAGPGS